MPSKKDYKLLISAALAASLVMTIGSDGLSESDDDRLLSAVFNKVVHNHVSQPAPETLHGLSIDEIIATLDPHTAYHSPAEYAALREMWQGAHGGLGIEYYMDEQREVIYVLNAYENTPAGDAGLQEGDLITHLDGRSVEGMSARAVSAIIKGDIGTALTLTIERNGEVLPDITVERGRIEISPVKSAMIDKDIGYLEIKTFNDKTWSAVHDSIRQFKAQHGDSLRGIVIDLRNNMGGHLDQAISTTDLFLADGVITSVGNAEERNRVYNAYEGDLAEDIPLVVLTSGMSASASEILAGALQDHGRAIILGTQTYGKGSVQTIYPLFNGGALRLTTALYFTPSGDSIQGQGITPDIGFLPREEEGAERGERHGEASLENSIENPSAIFDERETARICRAAPDGTAIEIDPDAVHYTGEPDYQLLCAVDALRGTESYTLTVPADTLTPQG